MDVSDDNDNNDDATVVRGGRDWNVLEVTPTNAAAVEVALLLVVVVVRNDVAIQERLGTRTLHV
jgi:hypothetical protein